MLQFPSIDVNLYNRQGRTALHLAAFRGHQAIVERLLCVKDIDVDRTTQVGIESGYLLSLEQNNLLSGNTSVPQHVRSHQT